MANTLPCPGRSRSSILRGAAKDMKGPKGQEKSKPLWHMWSVRGSEEPDILVRFQGAAPEEREQDLSWKLRLKKVNGRRSANSCQPKRA